MTDDQDPDAEDIDILRTSRFVVRIDDPDEYHRATDVHEALEEAFPEADVAVQDKDDHDRQRYARDTHGF